MEPSAATPQTAAVSVLGAKGITRISAVLQGLPRASGRQLSAPINESHSARATDSLANPQYGNQQARRAVTS